MAAAAATIEEALGSIDAEERRLAAAELSGLPIGEALPLLLRALGDDDWRVRKQATITARAFGNEAALVRALVGALGDAENVGLRNAAVDVLAASGRAATRALGEAFGALDADGRKLVVETLGKGRDPDAVDLLEHALRDPDENVRQGAIEAAAGLGPLAPDRVAALLLSRLDDADRLVRLTALEGLTALEAPVPWARLAPLFDDPTLRSAALAAAALAESPEAAAALAEALAGARGSAFDQALSALGKLAGGPLAESVRAAISARGEDLGRRLVAAARSDASPARREAALTLLGLAPASAPGVVEAAVDALGEDLLAAPAQRALVALGPGALPEMLARLDAAALPPEARAALVDVVGEVAATSAPPSTLALEALRRAARDPEHAEAHPLRTLKPRPMFAGADRAVAVRAVAEVGRLGGAEDLELCAEHTLSASRPLAAAAAGALAQLAYAFPAAARALAERLGRDERSLLPATIAVGAAARRPPFEERDALFLAHAAAAGDPSVRRAAVEAVAELRASFGAEHAGAIEVLRIALTDEEHEVRLVAARALGKLCTAADPPAVSDVLDLGDRSGEPDLVAAAVRAIGQGLAQREAPLGAADHRGAPEDLVPALGVFAGGAPSPVAIAAVEALAEAHQAGVPSALGALAAALDHPDEGVVRAALYKLAGAAAHDDAALALLARGLGHARPAVRERAVELLADARPEEARRLLVPRLAVEQDRRVIDAIGRALSAVASSRAEGG